MRRLLVLTVVLVAALAGPAGAEVSATEVGAALRRDPVYVADDADVTISAADAEDLRDAIRARGEAVFVAVVGSSLGTADDALDAVRRATGLSGTYAVVTDDGFRAASDVVPDASAIATSVFQRERPNGAAAVLDAFVDAIGSTPVSSGGGASVETSDERRAPSVLPLLLLGGVAVGAVALIGRRGSRRVRRESQVELDADRQLLRAELSVLADDVLTLEQQVALHPDARVDYDAAVSRYRAAEAALDYADEAVDLVRVERVVREAQYAMSRARAVIEGRTPPPPPEDLRRPGRHDEPPLDVDDRGEPVYVGHPGGFYGGGWFGGSGGLFTGLLLGQMLGGFGGFGHHQDITIVDGDGGGGWGDVGGGDWGGGDAGGGDW